MSTRGITGFVLNDKAVGSYNHYDSYFEDLGASMIDQSRKIILNFDKYKELATKIKLVAEDDKPNPIEISNLIQFSQTHLGNSGVQIGAGTVTEWYNLLRDLQGNLLGQLEVGYMIDTTRFTEDSLFCEYGYFFNFDNKTLEVYRGFQENKDLVKGRFANSLSLEEIDKIEKGEYSKYYEISLIHVFNEVDLLKPTQELIETLEQKQSD